MKRLFLIPILFVFLFGCVATNKSLWEKPQVSVNPMVTKWLEAPAKSPNDTLAVIIITQAPLSDYTFLKKISRNRYTGHVTKIQLKKLMNDERVLRINTGKQKLY